jgi:sensor histidine kinase YesM
MSRNFMKIKYHILFWLSYVIYAFFADLIMFPDFDIRIFLVFFLSNQIFIIYSSIYFFSKFSFKSVKAGLKTISLLLFFLAVFCFIRYLYLFYYHPFITGQQPKDIPLIKYLTNALIFYIRFSFVGLAYFFAIKYTRSEQIIVNANSEKLQLENRNLELELQNKELFNRQLQVKNDNLLLAIKNEDLAKQKLEAENEALRAQINPHFLFNTLNFFFGKTIKTDQEVANGIHALSTLMRGAFNKPGEDGMIELEQEIEMIEKLIEIYRFRYDNSINIKFTKCLNSSQMRIVPHILMTLVENAFKHGELEDANFPLTINLRVDKELFFFSVTNKKSTGEKYSSNGIGLEFIKRRLSAVYGKRYSFIINDFKDSYRTELSIMAS